MSIVLPKTVYHGTTSNHLKSIKNKIDKNKGSSYCDFGKGFYTTSNFNQAAEWARKRQNSFNLLQFNPTCRVDAIIVTYELDILKLQCLNGKIFQNQDNIWAKFIYKNRSKKVSYNHNYDYLFGPVADGKTDELIKNLDNGIIEVDKLRTLISHGFPLALSNQLSFHTENAISCLSYKKEEVIYHASKKRAR